MIRNYDKTVSLIRTKVYIAFYEPLLYIIKNSNTGVIIFTIHIWDLCHFFPYITLILFLRVKINVEFCTKVHYSPDFSSDLKALWWQLRISGRQRQCHLIRNPRHLHAWWQSHQGDLELWKNPFQHWRDLKLISEKNQVKIKYFYHWKSDNFLDWPISIIL